MDPTACLRRIGYPARINADVRAAMADLHNWLAGGGCAPDWSQDLRGTDRFLRVYSLHSHRLPRWDIRLAPNAHRLAIVYAATAERAKRLAPKFYRRRAAGEIYAERVA